MPLAMVFGSKNTAAVLPHRFQANRRAACWRFTVLARLGLYIALFSCCIPTTFLAARLGAVTHAQELWMGKVTPQSKRIRSSRSSITRTAASDYRMSKPKRLRWYSAVKWRVRAAAVAALVGALLSPTTAWARTIHRVASRGQERQATYWTMGIIALLFVFAWFNSKKEDSSEDTRIRAEVERLVRLKKEFEETEAAETEGTDDDSMAASLRAAQQSMADKQQGDEGKDGVAADDGVEGENSSAGGTGDVMSGDISESGDEEKKTDSKSGDGDQETNSKSGPDDEKTNSKGAPVPPVSPVPPVPPVSSGDDGKKTDSKSGGDDKKTTSTSGADDKKANSKSGDDDKKTDSKSGGEGKDNENKPTPRPPPGPP
eukprot:CAMPEP_0172860178 /NCGR_PEP_ID=MMETSP1075-20121228/71938_1 /TAXON_ID=2916 /ORGANISM="Ceratium fusus, Strain PA161109" /LENGTH=371 /DNA_ID=CAMNT_0013708175 /DNA_START=37 /DNA_END=1149 /DNA_ORIENTATION=-